jgi:hypothetical protein
MRFSAMAAAVCLSVLMGGGFADVPGTAASASSAAPAAQSPAPAAAPAGDAAAKHAKRTECLRDAKAKKLVGADKTAFLKSCIEPP